MKKVTVLYQWVFVWSCCTYFRCYERTRTISGSCVLLRNSITTSNECFLASLAWFRPCTSANNFLKYVDYRKDKGNGLGLYLGLSLHRYLPQAILWITLYHVSTHLKVLTLVCSIFTCEMLQISLCVAFCVKIYIYVENCYIRTGPFGKISKSYM